MSTKGSVPKTRANVDTLTNIMRRSTLNERDEVKKPKTDRMKVDTSSSLFKSKSKPISKPISKKDSMKVDKSKTKTFKTLGDKNMDEMDKLFKQMSAKGGKKAVKKAVKKNDLKK